MQPGRLNILIDGQWGSVGKGKLAGFLALRSDIACATVNFSANAGHTFVYDDGTKVVTHQLPTAVINQDTRLLLNAGAMINPTQLEKEIEEYLPTRGDKHRLVIHPHAVVITEEDKAWEKETLTRVSSTLQGGGAALARKVMRIPDVTLAKDHPLTKPFVGDTTEILHQYLAKKAICVAEGAQGFELSLNHGTTWPYTTSRDVTPAQILNDAGCPPQFIGTVYGCLRTFPIRVGHAFVDGEKVGDSGPVYPDQRELTWEELTEMSGCPQPLMEKTTVTNKVRRIFTFSFSSLRRFVQVCHPDVLFLNFVNYLDWKDYQVRKLEDLSAETKAFVRAIENQCGVRVSFLGTGPLDSDMVVRK